MFHHALGVFPFKDDFFSNNQTQTNCSGYPNCQEPYSWLKALVSTLSTGPVAPSDKIGYLDLQNLMQTCRSDGLLIKPDVPATTMDIVFQAGFSMPKGPQLQHLIHTCNNHSATFNGKITAITWHYILAANLDIAFKIGLEEIGEEVDSSLVVFEYFSGASTFTTLNSSKPLLIPALPYSHTTVNYRYYIIAPRFIPDHLGYTLLGETDKYVVASKQRIKSILLDSSSSKSVLTVTLIGSESEIVNLEVLHISGILEKHKCTLGIDGVVGLL